MVERSSVQVDLQRDASCNWIVADILTQAGESHVFLGSETPAKEWECVLIYDEETGVR
jgi:hypothetical protein